jgi:type IV pilus assembly protein PilC
MSTFAFRAIDVAGTPSRGELEAATKGQVTEQLRQRGLIVLDVSEKHESIRVEGLFDRFQSVSMRNLSVFSRQFATLIASGMPMLRSLSTLEDQTED